VFVIKWIYSLAIALSLVLAAVASAQDLEPRSYVNLPVGMNFLGVALIRSDGDLSPTPSSPLQDAELTIDVGALFYGRTFAIAGSSSKLNVTAGRTCYEGSATFRGEYTEGRRCEYTDPRVKLNWNFYGAPAMGMKEFRQWQGGLVAGASLMATIPLGTYDSDHIINAGANRWMLRPGLGMSWRAGSWQFELQAAVSFFEDNDDFFGGIHVEQDPLYAINAHIIYNLRKGRWVSVDANYFAGGETTKDGQSGDDRQENSRFGLTYSTPLTQQLSLKIYASTGMMTRVGNEFESLGLGLLYRF
jgi:hypothetical protein